MGALKATIILMVCTNAIIGLGQAKVDKEYSLMLFLLDDCVISRANMSHINELFNSYNHLADFTGYFPNFSSKPENIEAFQNELNVAFPLKTDYFKELAKLYKISALPEVVIVQNKTNNIVYQGAITNEFLDIGKRRNTFSELYLENALSQLAQNRFSFVSKTRAVGCAVNYVEMGK